MVDGEMMSNTLELSSVGEWMVLGFTQDCSKGQVTCEMLLSAGGEVYYKLSNYVSCIGLFRS